MDGARNAPEQRAQHIQDARDLVEYCNGPASSKWGKVRAANGHAEPYGVKYWEIGNEIWGSWVRGHSDAATYARNFRQYRAAMDEDRAAVALLQIVDGRLEVPGEQRRVGPRQWRRERR